MYCRFSYQNGLNLFDFNAESGILSNPRNIDFPDLSEAESGWTGVQFLPNSRFIYATTYTRIFQLDLLAPDLAVSRTQLGGFSHSEEIPFKARFNDAFLAPNGKIYVGVTNQ